MKKSDAKGLQLYIRMKYTILADNQFLEGQNLKSFALWKIILGSHVKIGLLAGT